MTIDPLGHKYFKKCENQNHHFRILLLSTPVHKVFDLFSCLFLSSSLTPSLSLSLSLSLSVYLCLIVLLQMYWKWKRRCL